jgi:hypothetical protein
LVIGEHFKPAGSVPECTRTPSCQKLTEVQRTVGQLLAQLQANEHDKNRGSTRPVAPGYRSACERAGKSGKQIEQLHHLDLPSRGEHGLPRRLPAVGGVVAGWRLRIAIRYLK